MLKIKFFIYVEIDFTCYARFNIYTGEKKEGLVISYSTFSVMANTHLKLTT
jgi:hypothetical protein